MPKLISTAEHARFTALAAAVSAALPEHDIDALLASEGALASALTPEPVTTAAEITDEQGAQLINDFFASCGIEIAADSSAETTLAELLGAQESFGIAASTLTAGGIDLEEIIAAADPAAALKEAFETVASKKGASIAAKAGAKLDELPETPAGDAVAEPSAEADFLTAIAAAEKDGDQALVGKLYSQMREKFPRKIK